LWQRENLSPLWIKHQTAVDQPVLLSRISAQGDYTNSTKTAMWIASLLAVFDPGTFRMGSGLDVEWNIHHWQCNIIVYLIKLFIH
jgi:hypothetical protein